MLQGFFHKHGLKAAIWTNAFEDASSLSALSGRKQLTFPWINDRIEMAAVAYAQAGLFVCIQKWMRRAMSRPFLYSADHKEKHGQALGRLHEQWAV